MGRSQESLPGSVFKCWFMGGAPSSATSAATLALGKNGKTVPSPVHHYDLFQTGCDTNAEANYISKHPSAV